jgi:hypothetical protein
MPNNANNHPNLVVRDKQLKNLKMIPIVSSTLMRILHLLTVMGIAAKTHTGHAKL